MSSQSKTPSEDKLAQILRDIDNALAQGRDLREQVVSRMRERQHNPIWPDKPNHDK